MFSVRHDQISQTHLAGFVVVGAGEPRTPCLQLLEAELTRPLLRSNVGHAAVRVARVDPGQKTAMVSSRCNVGRAKRKLVASLVDLGTAKRRRERVGRVAQQSVLLCEGLVERSEVGTVARAVHHTFRARLDVKRLPNSLPHAHLRSDRTDVGQSDSRHDVSAACCRGLCAVSN